jgi:hypothetical protein
MSVATAVGAQIAKQQSGDVPEPPGVDPGILARLVMWVPTESIGIYAVVLAALGQLSAPDGKKVCDASFHSRWLTLIGVTVFTAALVLVFYGKKARDAKVHFKLPWFQLIFCPTAFVAWALALPDSVLLTRCGYHSAWGIAILTVTTFVISIAAWFFDIRPPTFDFGRVMPAADVNEPIPEPPSPPPPQAP